jgi:uncharacterized metal-binding protein
MPDKNKFHLQVVATDSKCPIGEAVGKRHQACKSTPVLSCEGACIRGEIARQAANIVARHPGFGRGCHGELLTVPGSAIARWFHQAEKVVLIDGCFLRCHGRVLEGLLDPDKLIQFDALSHYKKYTDIFDPEDVDREELQSVARDVAEWVLESLSKGNTAEQDSPCFRQKTACSG